VSKNYAVINWKEYWKQDIKVHIYSIKWGKKGGIFTDSLNLLPYDSGVVNSDTLHSLTESTEYWAEFNRDYNRKLYQDTFYFNTPTLPTVPPVSVITPSVKPHSSLLDNARFLDLYSANGKRVFHTALNSLNQITIHQNSIKTPGMYIACYKNSNNQTLISEKLLINY
jgi:hypothetical protein